MERLTHEADFGLEDGSRYYIEFQQIQREPTIFLISLRGGCTMMNA